MLTTAGKKKPRLHSRGRYRPATRRTTRWWILTNVRTGQYHFLNEFGDGWVTACNQLLYKETPRFYNKFHTKNMRYAKRCKDCVRALKAK